MTKRSLVLRGVVFAAFVFGLSPALAQAPGVPSASATYPEGPHADQQLGKRFQIKAEELPPPNTGPVVSNPPVILPYQGQSPRVPDGFTVTPFVVGLEHPRRLLVLPNGDVIVAEQKPGYLTLLRDEDGDGRADWIQRHAEGFTGPYGLAWWDGHILVADQVGIWRVPHTLGAVRAGHGQRSPSPRCRRSSASPTPTPTGRSSLRPRACSASSPAI